MPSLPQQTLQQPARHKEAQVCHPSDPNHGYFTACYRCAQEICVRMESGGQSIYKCQYDPTLCDYSAAQHGATYTHVRHKHLRVCVKCRLCNKKSFRSSFISTHLDTQHAGMEVQWFEPIPILKGDLQEVSAVELADHINEVKKEPKDQFDSLNDDEDN